MRIKFRYIIPICVAVLGSAVYLTSQIPHLRKTPIYIAVAGPMSGNRKPAGQAMIKGIRLYADKVNNEGGIDGRKVELLIFDDKAQEKLALDLASRIADDKRVLLVLGHYTSGASMAAGRVYRKSGLAAITASATAGPVTDGNPWYFRTIANNSFQGAYIATYANTCLGKESACIIYDEDSYGQTLAGDFESAAAESRIKIVRKWGFHADSKNLDDDIKKIASELRSIEDHGILFLAAHGNEGATIVATLKHSGANHTIFGPDAFTTKSFVEQFEKFPMENAKPGYYSEGIYAVSPLLLEIGDENAHHFTNDYKTTYKEEPFWPAATYYDAMAVAVEAIKKADIQGEGHSRRDRREIRDAIASIHSPEYAVSGLNGMIYFDKNGDSHAPLAVGRYERNLFLPSFTQYTLRPATEGEGDDVLEKVLEGKMIIVKEQTLNKTSVVYTGVDVNEITDLDIKNGTYTMDFYVWFRYAGDLPGDNVVFPNAVNPIILKEPIVNESANGVTIRAYHVTADFKSDLDFREFPFDRHTLFVKYHHANMRCGELVYVIDVLGMPRTVGKSNVGKINLNAHTGWRIEGRHYYQDVISNMSTFGVPQNFDDQNKVSYSQFNVAINIARAEFGFVVRYMLPVLIIFLLVFSAYFVPFDRTATRICIIMGSLVITAVYHVYHLREIPVEYGTILEYTLLAQYLLIAICMGISIVIVGMTKAGVGKKARLFNRIGKLAHFPIALVIACVIAWMI